MPSFSFEYPLFEEGENGLSSQTIELWEQLDLRNYSVDATTEGVKVTHTLALTSFHLVVDDGHGVEVDDRVDLDSKGRITIRKV